MVVSSPPHEPLSTPQSPQLVLTGVETATPPLGTRALPLVRDDDARSATNSLVTSGVNGAQEGVPVDDHDDIAGEGIIRVDETDDDDGDLLWVKGGIRGHSRRSDHFVEHPSSKTSASSIMNRENSGAALSSVTSPPRGGDLSAATTPLRSRLPAATPKSVSSGSLRTAQSGIDAHMLATSVLVQVAVATTKVDERKAKFTAYRLDVTLLPELVATMGTIGSGAISWHVWRRYREFHSLHTDVSAHISENYPGIAGAQIPPLPPKKFLGMLDPGFVEERRLALSGYLASIVANRFSWTCASLYRFLDREDGLLSLILHVGRERRRASVRSSASGTRMPLAHSSESVGAPPSKAPAASAALHSNSSNHNHNHNNSNSVFRLPSPAIKPSAQVPRPPAAVPLSAPNSAFSVSSGSEAGLAKAKPPTTSVLSSEHFRPSKGIEAVASLASFAERSSLSSEVSPATPQIRMVIPYGGALSGQHSVLSAAASEVGSPRISKSKGPATAITDLSSSVGPQDARSVVSRQLLVPVDPQAGLYTPPSIQPKGAPDILPSPPVSTDPRTMGSSLHHLFTSGDVERSLTAALRSTSKSLLLADQRAAMVSDALRPSQFAESLHASTIAAVASMVHAATGCTVAATGALPSGCHILGDPTELTLIAGPGYSRKWTGTVVGTLRAASSLLVGPQSAQVTHSVKALRSHPSRARPHPPQGSLPSFRSAALLFDDASSVSKVRPPPKAPEPDASAVDMTDVLEAEARVSVGLNSLTRLEAACTLLPSAMSTAVGFSRRGGSHHSPALPPHDQQHDASSEQDAHAPTPSAASIDRGFSRSAAAAAAGVLSLELFARVTAGQLEVDGPYQLADPAVWPALVSGLHSQEFSPSFHPLVPLEVLGSLSSIAASLTGFSLERFQPQKAHEAVPKFSTSAGQEEGSDSCAWSAWGSANWAELVQDLDPQQMHDSPRSAEPAASATWSPRSMLRIDRVQVLSSPSVPLGSLLGRVTPVLEALEFSVEGQEIHVSLNDVRSLSLASLIRAANSKIAPPGSLVGVLRNVKALLSAQPLRRAAHVSPGEGVCPPLAVLVCASLNVYLRMPDVFRSPMLASCWVLREMASMDSSAEAGSLGGGIPLPFVPSVVCAQHLLFAAESREPPMVVAAPGTQDEVRVLAAMRRHGSGGKDHSSEPSSSTDRLSSDWASQSSDRQRSGTKPSKRFTRSRTALAPWTGPGSLLRHVMLVTVGPARVTRSASSELSSSSPVSHSSWIDELRALEAAAAADLETSSAPAVIASADGVGTSGWKGSVAREVDRRPDTVETSSSLLPGWALLPPHLAHSLFETETKDDTSPFARGLSKITGPNTSAIGAAVSVGTLSNLILRCARHNITEAATVRAQTAGAAGAPDPQSTALHPELIARSATASYWHMKRTCSAAAAAGSETDAADPLDSKPSDRARPVVWLHPCDSSHNALEGWSALQWRTLQRRCRALVLSLSASITEVENLPGAKNSIDDCFREAWAAAAFNAAEMSLVSAVVRRSYLTPPEDRYPEPGPLVEATVDVTDELPPSTAPAAPSILTLGKENEGRYHFSKSASVSVLTHALPLGDSSDQLVDSAPLRATESLKSSWWERSWWLVHSQRSNMWEQYPSASACACAAAESGSDPFDACLQWINTSFARTVAAASLLHGKDVKRGGTKALFGLWGLAAIAGSADWVRDVALDSKTDLSELSDLGAAAHWPSKDVSHVPSVSAANGWGSGTSDIPGVVAHEWSSEGAVAGAPRPSDTDVLFMALNRLAIVADGEISIKSCVQLISSLLRRHGPLPVGELGKLLHDSSQSGRVMSMIRAKFGGLKKFLQEIGDEAKLTVGTDHPYNPHVWAESAPPMEEPPAAVTDVEEEEDGTKDDLVEGGDGSDGEDDGDGSKPAKKRRRGRGKRGGTKHKARPKANDPPTTLAPPGADGWASEWTGEVPRPLDTVASAAGLFQPPPEPLSYVPYRAESHDLSTLPPFPIDYSASRRTMSDLAIPPLRQHHSDGDAQQWATKPSTSSNVPISWSASNPPAYDHSLPAFHRDHSAVSNAASLLRALEEEHEGGSADGELRTPPFTGLPGGEFFSPGTAVSAGGDAAARRQSFAAAHKQRVMEESLASPPGLPVRRRSARPPLDEGVSPRKPPRASMPVAESDLHPDERRLWSFSGAVHVAAGPERGAEDGGSIGSHGSSFDGFIPSRRLSEDPRGSLNDPSGGNLWKSKGVPKGKWR
jgi:hypothetical protein